MESPNEPQPAASGASAGAAGPAPLVVAGLTKSYEGRLAVSGLSFEVAPGSILGLVGPNGAGKTTTLRSVAGVLPVREGRVAVCGHDIEREPTEAKRRLCWVPDDPQPFDTLTVAEHLEFTAALYGLGDWRARADELLTRFELADRRDALGGELSRGMRQKLAFCCAWLPRPSLMLMDEPLSGLDPRGIRAAKQALRELAAEGTAVILSSHLLSLIEELASRILILAAGRKVFEGSLAELRAAARAEEGTTLEEVFLAVTENGAADAPG